MLCFTVLMKLSHLQSGQNSLVELWGVFHRQNVPLLVEDVAGLKKQQPRLKKLLQDNKDKEQYLISRIIKGEKNRPNKLLVQNFQTVSHLV